MERNWWKEASVYQIYPRSYKDTNNDGIGDLRGITSKLDYIKNLGINVIWISPFFASPNDDNGYDISNYREIHPDFGTMEDFDELLSGIHERGMKLLVDLVVNHSSDEHPWFKESRKSRDNKYRDYYIWRDGKNDGPPNDWGSVFSGPAWEYDENTDQYYLHLFSKKQPDLNWENPVLRNEVYDIMRFWLDKGVDGFRMDVINLISKKLNKPGEEGPEVNHMGPRLHEFLQEMNREVLRKYDIMTVGECPGTTVEDAIKLTSPDRNELNMIFIFEHMDLDNGPSGKWELKKLELKELKKTLGKFQEGLHGKAWNSLYLNNHDQPRMVSRFGNDSGKYREVSAKMLAHITNFMEGTPYIYQGEELGMTNLDIESMKDIRDIESINAYNALTSSGKMTEEEMLRAIRAKGRDNARTPIQWDDSGNAGFTDGTPWLKVNSNYKELNAKAQVNNPDSVYSYYKRILSLRAELPVIVYGRYEPVFEDSDEVFAWTRSLGKEKLICLNNFTDKSVELDIDSVVVPDKYELLISNYGDTKYTGDKKLTLKPYEAVVLYSEDM